MITDDKIAYIRNCYSRMLRIVDMEFLNVNYSRCQALIEAWFIDGSISYEMQKELDKEVEAVYNFCVDTVCKQP